MALINITTTEAEQSEVLEAIKSLQGKTISIAGIAKHTSLKESRVRYAVVDLECANKIRKIPTKAFNSHYIRYRYELV